MFRREGGAKGKINNIMTSRLEQKFFFFFYLSKKKKKKKIREKRRLVYTSRLGSTSSLLSFI